MVLVRPNYDASCADKARKSLDVVVDLPSAREVVPTVVLDNDPPFGVAEIPQPQEPAARVINWRVDYGLG